MTVLEEAPGPSQEDTEGGEGTCTSLSLGPFPKPASLTLEYRLPPKPTSLTITTHSLVAVVAEGPEQVSLWGSQDQDSIRTLSRAALAQKTAYLWHGQALSFMAGRSLCYRFSRLPAHTSHSAVF